MTERCLVLIKPDGLSRGLLPTIISRIQDAGLIITEQKYITASEEQCRGHYHVKTRNYGATETQIVDYLCKSYVKDNSVCALIVEGENAVAVAHEIKMKIRKEFGIDTIEKADSEGRALHNVMHASETPAHAEMEIEIWFHNKILTIG